MHEKGTVSKIHEGQIGNVVGVYPRFIGGMRAN
jgi:hypothetical protein